MLAAASTPRRHRCTGNRVVSVSVFIIIVRAGRMQLRPGAALAVLALVLCCLCEAATEVKLNTKVQVNATKTKVNATSVSSDASAQRVLQKVMRWVRQVLQIGDYTYPGGDIVLESSDADYLVNQEGAFRGITYRDLEDNRIIGFADFRNIDFGDTGDRVFVPQATDKGVTPETTDRRLAPEIKDSGFTPDTRNEGFSFETRDEGLTHQPKTGEVTSETREQGTAMSDRSFAPETRDYGAIKNRLSGTDQSLGVPQTPNSNNNSGRDSPTNAFLEPTTRNLGRPTARSFDLSRGIAAADQGFQSSLSSSSAGQRWLSILAEFLKTSQEGRELLRAQTGQLLVGVDLEAGQLPRPLLLLPVPLENNSSDLRPVEEDNEFHRTLLKQFRAAQPKTPNMPPLLLPTSPLPVPAAPLPPLLSIPPPARLRFDRSLLIRADLTVFFSDYTEPYTVWYDVESGSSRVDMHGGTTVLYRAVQPGGNVQRVQWSMERFGEDEIRRCRWLSTRAVAADSALPGLPDPTPFSFTGYQDTADGRMERWSYSLAGQAGELGAARGEALLFRHELLVARVEPDFAIPYKYRVTVDSSVLGPEADWYEHRYLEVREQRPDATQLRIDVERACDSLQRVHRVDEVDPLREYVMTHRDSRCDVDFEKFKETHQVNYEDPVDEAVRKTLLIRSTRFVESANRQGAMAKMENNALGVKLPSELRVLGGTRPDANRQEDETEDEEDTEGEEDSGSGEGILGAVPDSFATLKPMNFPYDVASMASQLPAAFSWRRQGGVTHIRNQGQCSSCWAFAVVCAVEGALFRRTRQLVPLSDQQLADCSRSKRSCSETGLVRNAYLQAKNSGILALGDYERYKFTSPKIEQCKKKQPVVTKISGFVEVPSDTTAIKVAIVNQGPVVMEVDSSCEGFRYFSTGVLQDKRCNANARNHAVAAVGYGRHKTVGDYFIIKNSWGDSVNEGYVHLHADSNTAGVLTAPTYPVLEDKDIPDKGSLAARATTYPDEPNIFKTTSDTEYMAFLKEQEKYLSQNPNAVVPLASHVT